MKVAAYQAPLIAEGVMESIDRMQQCVRECETNGVSVLCFPEAILGGLVNSVVTARCTMRLPYINAAESRACTARFIQPYVDRYIALVRKHLYFARAS